MGKPSVKVGDIITGTYETSAKTVSITGKVTSIHGDYVYVSGQPVHINHITHVNGVR